MYKYCIINKSRFNYWIKITEKIVKQPFLVLKRNLFKYCHFCKKYNFTNSNLANNFQLRLKKIFFQRFFAYQKFRSPYEGNTKKPPYILHYPVFYDFVMIF